MRDQAHTRWLLLPIDKIMFEQRSAPSGLSEGRELVLPAIDDCDYRLLTLDNGLRALLVHDPVAEKAAAACDVSQNPAGWVHHRAHGLQEVIVAI